MDNIIERYAPDYACSNRGLCGCELCDLIEYSRQIQAELEKHRWIPTSERLPKTEQEVIVYSPKFVGSKFCVLIWWKEAFD